MGVVHMQILTPTGYKDIADCGIGDEVCAFDMATGAPIINHIELIEPVDLTEWQRWWQVEPSIPPFDFYLVNGAFTLFREQSIWRNADQVVHARDLVVGDTIYDDADDAVAVTSIVPVVASAFYRLEIDGDHSYITDGLTLHNASRFWVGGTGTWDSSTTTHWAATTGGSGGQTVPGSSDAVTFDGSSGGGTVTVNFGGTITVQSITCGAFTGTLDFSANNNSVTLLLSGTAFSGTGSATRTLNLGSGTWTLTGANATWTIATTTGLTFSGASSTIVFSGNPTATNPRTFSGGALTYGTVTFNAISAGGYQTINNNPTITSLNIAGPNYIALNGGGQSVTVTNSFSINGTSGNEITFSTNITATNTTISSANNGSCSWCAFRYMTFAGGGTFTATNSFDLGGNTGITITAPATGGGGGPFTILM